MLVLFISSPRFLSPSNTTPWGSHLPTIPTTCNLAQPAADSSVESTSWRRVVEIVVKVRCDMITLAVDSPEAKSIKELQLWPISLHLRLRTHLKKVQASPSVAIELALSFIRLNSFAPKVAWLSLVYIFLTLLEELTAVSNGSKILVACSCKVLASAQSDLNSGLCSWLYGLGDWVEKLDFSYLCCRWSSRVSKCWCSESQQSGEGLELHFELEVWNWSVVWVYRRWIVVRTGSVILRDRGVIHILTKVYIIWNRLTIC